MKMILSTLSAPQTVVITEKGADGSMKPSRFIRINGGANVANRKTLDTPYGVVTELEDADYDALIVTDVWKHYEKYGFMKPVSSAKAADDPEKQGMAACDGGAQLSAEDLTGGVQVNGGEAAEVTPKKKRGRPKKVADEPFMV